MKHSYAGIAFFSMLSLVPAAAQFPEMDGYEATMTNFKFIANGVVTTREAVQILRDRD